jgi:hypothetical protein
LFQETAKADHETKLRITANNISIFTETSPYLNKNNPQNQKGNDWEKHSCQSAITNAKEAMWPIESSSEY